MDNYKIGDLVLFKSCNVLVEGLVAVCRQQDVEVYVKGQKHSIRKSDIVKVKKED